MRITRWAWTGAVVIALSGCGLTPGAGPAQAGEAAGAQSAAPAAGAGTDGKAAAPARASAEAVRERYNALFPASCRVLSVAFSERGALLRGNAESSAAIAEAMRAIDRAQRLPSRLAGADLLSVERKPDGAYAFEMVLNDPASYAP